MGKRSMTEQICDAQTTKSELPFGAADPQQCTASSTPNRSVPDPMVCFCYRYTVAKLKAAHQQLGSLAALQNETKVGTACGGCRASLSAIFSEDVLDINNLKKQPMEGSTCAKPGQRLMTGFVVADGSLESKVVSCNAIAPQLGDCNATTEFQYALLDHRAQIVMQDSRVVETGEVFSFDTRSLALPRPFFGTFIIDLKRSNFGASRFNIQWGNGRSITSTHENGPTGRPRVFLPIFLNRKNIDGPNTIHLGLLNPRFSCIDFKVVLFDRTSNTEEAWNFSLPPFQSTWININEIFARPLLDAYPSGDFGVKIESNDLTSIDAVTAYFFLHNRSRDVWSCQHL